MADTMRKDPHWWTSEHDSAWDRIKDAFHRDWEQTKHDFGGKAPDMDQDVDDTVGQMMGTKPVPPMGQPAHDHDDDHRFGYGAGMQYGNTYHNWDDKLETQLRSDWDNAYGGASGMDWDSHRDHVRHGWDYHMSANRRAKAA